MASDKLVSESAPIWKNWSQNLVHNPPTDGDDYYFTPKNLQELKDVVANAVAAGVTLRASGQRHSQPALVANDNRGKVPSTPKEFLVDMSCYADLGPGKDQNMVVDFANKQITVNAGVREDDVDALLTANNLILKTVTAGGFFSLGGMTAVDVHGATVQEGIFAETVSSFSIMDATGTVHLIDATTPDYEGIAPLRFVRVSLGAFGIVTSMTIDVLDRPYATTLAPSRKVFGPGLFGSVKGTFVKEFQALLTEHDRVESFFNPYADNLITQSFLALNWDLDPNPAQKVPNPTDNPPSACTLAQEDKFGAPFLTGEALAEKAALLAQESDLAFLAYAINQAAVITIQNEVDAANKRYSDLWLTSAARVIFMSYFLPLPNIDQSGLEHAWEGLAVVQDYVTQSGNFHTAAPMEFRFIKAGDTTMAGTFDTDPNTIFINYDLIGFVAREDDNTPGLKYTPELLKFFATVERKWVSMGALPHNGKMYGFYDPSDPDKSSSTTPFNPQFLKFITGQRVNHGAPVDTFKKYRQSVDPNDLFYNSYLRNLLG